MHEPTICTCVSDDIMQPLKWMLKDFNKDFQIASYHSITNFEAALKNSEWDLFILESSASHESIVPYLRKLKQEKPGLKVILIVPPVADKNEIMEVIKAKLVQGLAVKPFTGEVICKYLGKELSGGPDKNQISGNQESR